MGVLVTDLTIFGVENGGVNFANPEKSTREEGITTVGDWGWIGEILLSSKRMTSLTMAQEARDRLAQEDNDLKGDKLRNGATAELI